MLLNVLQIIMNHLLLLNMQFRLRKLLTNIMLHVRILEDDAQLDGRLALISATSIVLKEALRLLGVAAPENM